jgi:oxysterol-binding protein-related protein 9/10/11
MTSLLKGRLSRASSTKSTTPDTQSLNDCANSDLSPDDGASPPLLPSSDGTAPIDPASLGLPADPATADNSESGKFRQLLGILRKALNVKDLSSLRISLPASLMEPVGNLEVWNYVDRPDFFCAMAGEEGELERMVGVVRWTCE